MPAWVVYLAWKMMPENDRPRLITTVHGLYSVNGYSAIMTRGDYVIAVSRTIRKYILDNYPKTDENKIVLIRRGVESKEFPYHYQPDEQWLQQWREQYPQVQGKYIVVLPGRITRLKGHLDFIKIIASLKQQQIPVAGLVVGGAHPKKLQYLEEVKAEVARSGLQDDIHFLGNRSDIREVMSVSDVILSLSNKPESFGRTTLEAIRLGIPAVAYDHGGVGEILADTFPEGLVPLGDTRAVEEKLVEFYHNKPEVKPTDLYQLQTMLDLTIELYEKAKK
jgi:glycosyltransferase involved in cell wall biosynthesis